MIRRLLDALFRPGPHESSNELRRLLTRVAAESCISPDGVHLCCLRCRYDLHGLAGDARCPECGSSVLATAIPIARMLTQDVEGDPADHPSRKPFNFIRETLGYPIDAFILVLDASRVASAKKTAAGESSPHVGAQTLCNAVQRLAVSHFGSKSEARAVFLDWNVRSSEDVGRIVWTMVKCGVMLAEPSDSAEQFNGLFHVDQWLWEDPG